MTMRSIVVDKGSSYEGHNVITSVATKEPSVKEIKEASVEKHTLTTMGRRGLSATFTMNLIELWCGGGVK